LFSIAKRISKNIYAKAQRVLGCDITLLPHLCFSFIQIFALSVIPLPSLGRNIGFFEFVSAASLGLFGGLGAVLLQ
jgi:hypothetical protein